MNHYQTKMNHILAEMVILVKFVDFQLGLRPEFRISCKIKN